MTLPRPIPGDLAEMIAERLRVIGDPTRIRILDLLRGSEMTVTEITRELGASQQNVSKHLGILHQAGVVSRRKQGTHALYKVADRSVFDLCERVCGGLELHVAGLQEVVETTR